MFSNYLKIAWRNLLKNKGYTAINITGLAVGVMNIVGMISLDFIKLVLIALLLAFPIAWWAMDQWLQSFAYSIGISWWIFALTGIIVIAITLITVSFQSIKASLTNPVKSLRTE